MEEGDERSDEDEDYHYPSDEDEDDLSDEDEDDLSDGDGDDFFDDYENRYISPAYVRYKFEHDDPNLIKLKIGVQDYFPDPHDIDWERDGKSIGRNTHVRELSFCHGGLYPIVKKDFKTLFRGISCNRSIRKLIFENCDKFIFDGEVLSILTPFFKNNLNFECLKILGIDGASSMRCLLSTALAKFDTLKEFELAGISGDVEGSYLQALSGHPDLCELNLSPYGSLGRKECDHLAALLQNPKSKLTVLKLERIGIGDKEAVILATGLSGNSTLTDLDLDWNYNISGIGWKAIFATLQCQGCRLQKLSMLGCSINGDTVYPLANAVIRNTCLRSLGISFFKPNPLDLNGASTATGWRKGTGYREGTGWRALENALTNNSSLKRLDLRGLDEITMVGWQAIASILESPHSGLEFLHLTIYKSAGNDVEGAISLANSLIDNNKLKELVIDGIPPLSTSNCWAAFKHLVCDGTSIMATHHSNHTLEKVSVNDGRAPKDLRSLLRINRENSESQAARLKIIRHYFREGFTVQRFEDMEWKVLPRAIAWVGKDGSRGELNNHFYGFIRSMSALLFD
mmetsp:Transcript_3533/g.7806  ORF Transcript_3533/g.7806 Transcript_3533/m.7806 type:complete len:570 (-) Transcript_3533:85-1794(-)